MKYSPFALALLSLAALACGDDTAAGPICTDEELAIPAENCTVPPDVAGWYYDIKSRDDLKRFCQSPCNRMASLHLTHIEGMTDMTPFSRIEVIEGTLDLDDNPDLASLRGLENLETVGSLQLNSNDRLTSIESLSSLKEVAVQGTPGSIHISYSYALETLDGLESLTTASSLVLHDNTELEDVSALQRLSELDSIAIDNNPKLPQCQVDRLIERTAHAETDVETYENGEGTCADTSQ